MGGVFMVFKISFSLSNTITLPLSYHHILQGCIYRILSSNPNYASFLHNKGYFGGNSAFKLFTFGLLDGRCRIQGKEITFLDFIHWEIRSADIDFCQILIDCLKSKEAIYFKNQPALIDSIECVQPMITADSLDIKMLSPIVLHHSVKTPEGTKTIYHTPLENDFSKYINDNFEKKYYAACQTKPPSKVYIETLSVGAKDKYVTRFKNQIYITGWKGFYKLNGNPDCLLFLYETGLGSKNSQGFGMFEVL